MNDSKRLVREPGWYWVRFGFLVGHVWEPAEYCLDGNYYEPYWKIFAQAGFVTDSAFVQIGERFFPPYPVNYS